MARRSKPCLEAVERELVAAGASYRVVINKHAKVWVLHGGREHLYLCGLTTGHHNRAVENSRAGIRRLLRQLGLLAPKPAPGIGSPDHRKGARL